LDELITKDTEKTGFKPRTDNRKGYYIVLSRSMATLQEYMALQDYMGWFLNLQNLYILAVPFINEESDKKINALFIKIRQRINAHSQKYKGYKQLMVFHIHNLLMEASREIMISVRPLLLQEEQDLMDDDFWEGME
jgi:hypothetical protein